MNESLKQLFNIEKYRGSTVDIVHVESLRRTANGEKPGAFEDRRKAEYILKLIQKLEDGGIRVRYINDLDTFSEPIEGEGGNIILGGAFVGQCMSVYSETVENHGHKVNIDMLLSLKLGM